MENVNLELIPPEDLIVENGIGIGDYLKIANDFDRIGKGITTNMINMDLIKNNHTVLDVGCGLGRLARPLVKFLEEGRGEYYGLDTTKTSIDWCKANYKKHKNFNFHFADVVSTYYNTSATTKASEYKFPYEDNKFDYVWSTSLFTHLVFEDFENYIKEMSRVMKPGAKMWNTYLVLDDVAMSLLDELNSKDTRHKLPYEVEGGRVRDLANPEAQIALYEDRIREVHKKYGFKDLDVRYGPWSGRTENVRAGGQDVIIATKA